MTTRTRFALSGIGALFFVTVGVVFAQLPGIGAGALLHPSRRHVTALPPANCVDTTFDGDNVTLKGWRYGASVPRGGTVVYLHGVADNRESAAGIVSRFAARGFDVVAYDSRAHGESSGDACTYGYFEKRDLHHVLDTVGPGPIVLIGTSLGGAVALQEAAGDPRITAVIAAESFSDLRTVASQRAPFVFTSGTIARALRLAEQQAHFSVDDVSPVRAASAITVPVLLFHGAADVDTPPDHSKRILAALNGPKRLILVPDAHHNESLNEDAWREIDVWLATALQVPRR
jgi:hypothetical protein